MGLPIPIITGASKDNASLEMINAAAVTRALNSWKISWRRPRAGYKAGGEAEGVETSSQRRRRFCRLCVKAVPSYWEFRKRMSPLAGDRRALSTENTGDKA
jgi:hypothetical protein